MRRIVFTPSAMRFALSLMKEAHDESFPTAANANRNCPLYLFRRGSRERGTIFDAHGILHRAGGFHGSDVDCQGSRFFQEAGTRP